MKKQEQKAVALGYSPGDSAPKILAVARNMMAKKILELAKEHDITIYRDPDLTEALSIIGVGHQVPDNLFKAVAEVLAYCYEVNSRFREKLSLNKS